MYKKTYKKNKDYQNQNKLDFDFAVNRDALKLAKAFAVKIKGAYVLLDEERGCARVCRKEKGNLLTFDFADYREKTIEGDIKHRDFTINTLSVDLMKVEPSTLIDECLHDSNRAKKDLKDKKNR